VDIIEAIGVAFEHRESAPTPDDLEYAEDVARVAKILTDDPSQVHLPGDGEDGPQSPLHWAAQCHLPRIAELLIKAGAEINQRSELRGKTPLLCALDQDLDSAAPRLIQTCELLQRAGADPTIANKSGKSPQEIAAQFMAFGNPIFEVLAGEIKGKKKKRR
jgi:ankyrin repeat protein